MAVEADGQAADYHYDLGMAYSQADRTEEACRSLARAVGLRPDHAQGWTQLGLL